MCDFVVSLANGLMGHSQQRAQARYAEMQAAAVERETDWQVNRHFESDATAMGDLLAAQAASGAQLAGSKSDLLLYAGFGQAVERQRRQHQGLQQARGLQADAAFRQSAATAALTGSLLQAGSAVTKAAVREGNFGANLLLS